MEKKTSNKKVIIILVALAVVAAACLALYFNLRPQTVVGAKQVTVQVVHKDGSTKEFVLKTDAEFLADVLLEGNVVEDNQEEYGLYILTADGETADEAKKEWWCVTKGGESVMKGAAEQPIADGERYELTFTVGW